MWPEERAKNTVSVDRSQQWQYDLVIVGPPLGSTGGT